MTIAAFCFVASPKEMGWEVRGALPGVVRRFT
jgi:hypothetical protein